MEVRRIEQLERTHVEELTSLFGELWWTPGRTREDVERMLAHSLVVAFVDDRGSLAAFARVLSDRVYKALVFDVVVAPALRGTGLGDRLVHAVLDHPELREVRHFELYCAPDMVPYYERFGFTSELGTLTFMRRDSGVG